MLQDMEKNVLEVQKNLKVAQDFQNIYDELKIQHKYFSIRDHVYLRVNPKKSSQKLGSCTKITTMVLWTLGIQAGSSSTLKNL